MVLNFSKNKFGNRVEKFKIFHLLKNIYFSCYGYFIICNSLSNIGIIN